MKVPFCDFLVLPSLFFAPAKEHNVPNILGAEKTTRNPKPAIHLCYGCGKFEADTEGRLVFYVFFNLEEMVHT